MMKLTAQNFYYCLIAKVLNAENNLVQIVFGISFETQFNIFLSSSRKVTFLMFWFSFTKAAVVLCNDPFILQFSLKVLRYICSVKSL